MPLNKVTEAETYDRSTSETPLAKYLPNLGQDVT